MNASFFFLTLITKVLNVLLASEVFQLFYTEFPFSFVSGCSLFRPLSPDSTS